MRNGSPSAVGNFWMNDVSSRTPPAADPSPDASPRASPATVGSLLCAASPTAVRNSGVAAAEISASRMVSVTREKSSDRNAATPMVPPIWRKNVADDVETPMSCGGSEFWMARVSGCIRLPSPKPNPNIASMIAQSGVSNRMNENANMQIVIRVVPMIGYGR